MKDKDTKKIYLHASIATALTLLAVISNYEHNFGRIVITVAFSLMIYALALVLTSFISGNDRD